jgi:protein-S-isoprenylcysteine O-methyltransferase Ste14
MSLDKLITRHMWINSPPLSFLPLLSKLSLFGLFISKWYKVVGSEISFNTSVRRGQKGAVIYQITCPNRSIWLFLAPVSTASWPTKTTIYRLSVIVRCDWQSCVLIIIIIATLRLGRSFSVKQSSNGDLVQKFFFLVPVPLPTPFLSPFLFFFPFLTFCFTLSQRGGKISHQSPPQFQQKIHWALEDTGRTTPYTVHHSVPYCITFWDEKEHNPRRCYLLQKSVHRQGWTNSG